MTRDVRFFDDFRTVESQDSPATVRDVEFFRNQGPAQATVDDVRETVPPPMANSEEHVNDRSS